jgi:hypothetical protein
LIVLLQLVDGEHSPARLDEAGVELADQLPPGLGGLGGGGKPTTSDLLPLAGERVPDRG